MSKLIRLTRKVEKAEAQLESREISFRASSEHPVVRTDSKGNQYLEVLSHRSDFSPIRHRKSKPELYLDHDSSQFVGRVTSLEIKNGAAFGTAKVSRSQRGEDVLHDLEDGIRGGDVSIGYSVNPDAIEIVGERDKTPIVRFNEWSLHEVSILSAEAADPTAEATRDGTESIDIDIAAAIRAAQRSTQVNLVSAPELPVEQESTGAQRAISKEGAMSTENKETKEASTEDNVRAAVEADRKRGKALREIGAEWNLRNDAERFIEDGKSVEAFRVHVMEQRKPVSEIRATQIPRPIDNKDYEKEARSVGLASFLDVMNGNCRTDDQKRARELVDELRRNGVGTGDVTVPLQAFIRNYSDPVTIATEGAAVKPTTLRDDLIENVFRDSSSLLQAGAVSMPGLVGTVDIPYGHTGAVATKLTNEGETGSPALNKPHYNKLTLDSITLASVVPLSFQMQRQTSPVVANMIREDIIAALAERWDKEGLDNLRIALTGGAQELSFVAEGNLWHLVVEQESVVNSAKTPNRRRAYLVNSTEVGYAKTSRKDAGSGFFVMDNEGRINSTNTVITNQLSNAVGAAAGVCESFYGEFSHMYLPSWGTPAIDLTLGPPDDNGVRPLKAFMLANAKHKYDASFSYCKDIVGATGEPA